MTVLHSLDPIDVGRWSRESLWSYVTRLAESHSLLVGDLIKEIIWPASGWPTHAMHEIRGGFKEFGYINGAGQVAQQWVDVLQRLTRRNDLARLTLLAAVGVARFDGAGRSTGAKCIECIRETVELGKTCFEQLSWTLSGYEACVNHNVLLTQNCHGCGSTDLAIVRQTARVGCCGKCGAWMGGAAFRAETATGCSRYTMAMSEGVHDLLGLLEEPKLTEVDGATVFEYAAKIAFGGSYAELARSVGIAKSTLSTMLARRTRPHIDKLLALSIVSGIPLKRLLFGSLNGRRLNAGAFKEPIDVPKISSPKRRPALDVARAERVLKKALLRGQAVSLTAVASGLGTSPDVLSANCPELSAQVVSRFAQQSHARNQVRLEGYRSQMLDGFCACVLANQFPTMRRLSTLLGTVVIKEESRAFYHHLLRKYGLEDKARLPEVLRANALQNARAMLLRENLQIAQQLAT